MLGYEVGIVTGGANPVCCLKPSYGSYETKIIVQQVAQLLCNEWIEQCEGPWGSMFVLAQNPHQENVVNMEDFIWRICALYHLLNYITKWFQFLIDRCDGTINILGDCAGVIWIISLDARQGYQQMSMQRVNREKLAFFALNDRKYCFNVIPSNEHIYFYTVMMKDLKDEWDKLSIIRITALTTIKKITTQNLFYQSFYS